jgi:hypothetical protein
MAGADSDATHIKRAFVSYSPRKSLLYAFLLGALAFHLPPLLWPALLGVVALDAVAVERHRVCGNLRRDCGCRRGGGQRVAADSGYRQPDEGAALGPGVRCDDRGD